MFRLRILPEHIIRKANPIILGVEVISGTITRGLTVSVGDVSIGVISGLWCESDSGSQRAQTGDTLAIKIEPVNDVQYGTHFTSADELHDLKSNRDTSSVE